MDILRLYQDFSIDHVTDGHKHCRPGWVQTECPFCDGNAGYHLGWNLQDGFFSCWRCGWHPPVLTLVQLLNLPEREVRTILLSYGVNRSVVRHIPKDKKEFSFPSNVEELRPVHKKYLLKRKFDIDKITSIWGIKGTGPLSTLDGIDYRFRIILPFTWNGHVVTFDSRDVTDKQENKYQACPIARETVEHKNILYGNQEAWRSTGIIVEGPTDVWRLGELAAATSGIKYKPQQVRVIANSFKRSAVVFDDEPQAQKQAKKLVADLRFRGVDAWIEKIKGDPGALSDNEAKELVRKIIRRK